MPNKPIKNRNQISELKKNRNKEFRKQKFSSIFNKYKRILIFAVLFTVVGSIAFGLYFVIFRTDTFKIQNINIIGDNQINLNEEFYSDIRKQSILGISQNYIISKLGDKVKNYSDIKLYKLFPSTLTIEFIKNSPSLVLVNVKEIDLLDFNANVTNKITDSTLTTANLNLEILDENYDKNSDLVKQKYLSKIETSEEKAKVNWSKVSDDDKQNTLNEMRSDIIAVVEAFKASAEEQIKKTDYSELPIVFDINLNTQTTESFNKDKVDFSLAILDLVTKNSLKYVRNEWISDYSFKVKLDNGKELIFSIKRDLSEQSRDLATLRLSRKLDEGRVFDLRSKNFTISN